MGVVIPVTESDIRRAMSRTKSNKAAARFLGISYWLYRRRAKEYIDKETGKSLYDLHMNWFGVGISQVRNNKAPRLTAKNIFNGDVNLFNYSTDQVKTRLILDGYLDNCCSRCGFDESRILDNKKPLLLNFKDGNKRHFELENLELMCYNCAYLLGLNVLTNQQIKVIEDYGENLKVKAAEKITWDLDKTHLESYLKEIENNLTTFDDEEIGSEFIDRI